MNWLKKIKVLAAVMFMFCFLVSASLTSCENKGQAAEEEGTEHPAEEKAEHPEGANEHPEKADSVQQAPQ